MSNLSDIKHEIRRLSAEDRDALSNWLEDTSGDWPSGYRVEEARPQYADSAPRLLTEEEYLEFEDKAGRRHEYINGAVYAMSGASLAHNQISFQLAMATSNRLRGGPCKVFLLDLKLKLELSSDLIFYYPDVMVACRREEWGTHFVRKPTVLAEVLSPSTQHIDRREKSLNYFRETSVEEYLVLSQEERRAVIYRRGERRELDSVAGAGAMLELRSLEISVPLDEVYEGVLG
jgi:Uma2 family endonuclease